MVLDSMNGIYCIDSVDSMNGINMSISSKIQSYTV